MKNFSMLNRLPVLFLAVLLVISACKKDEDSKKDFRLVESTDFTNDVQVQLNHYIYEGEKITEILGNQMYGDSVKVQYEYPDDNLLNEFDYSKSEGAWSQDGKAEYTYSGGNLTSVIYYQTAERSMEPYFKVLMDYQNELVQLETYWLYYGNSWIQVSAIEYTYNNDKLVQTLVTSVLTGNWEPMFKEIITYAGDNIDFILEYAYAEGAYVENYKYDVTFTGDKVSRIENYQYMDNAWILDYEDNYLYDADGNLSEMSETTDGETVKTEFVYEKGKGNLNQVFYMGGGAISKFIPMPTKAMKHNFVSEAEKYVAKFKE